jgi:hypothetical protein
MSPRTLAAAIISLLAVGGVAIEAVSWPLSARVGPPEAATMRCAVRLDALTPADRRAGLYTGDVIELNGTSVSGRVATTFHYTPTQAGRAGETAMLSVSRAGRAITVPYTLMHTDSLGTFLAQLIFKLMALGIGGFVLWRGAGTASLLLGIWCASLAVGLPDAWWGILPADGRIFGGLVTALLWTISPFILYLLVESLSPGVSRSARVVARTFMAAFILPELLINAVDTTAQAVTGCALVAKSPWVANTLFTASQLVIIAFFALSYARTTGLAKQRIRWVFWAFMLSRIGVLLNLTNRILVHPVQLSGLEWATVMIFPLGCTYAILRYRIIDVNFVLNRTLVLTILTSLIVGVFILLEDLLGIAAASHTTSLIVEILVALGIGFSFNAIHRYLEGIVARAIFRAKHEAANVLRRLAQEAPFMESADALLRRTVEEVRAASGATATSIYERVGDAYRLSAWSGSDAALETLPVDDLAFVRMRTMRAPVDLSGVTSLLGSDGMMFPLSTRGLLGGALVCRRRPNGEAYAPDEIALLSSVAHECGAEVHAIRARAQSELLDALLGGKLDVGEARALLRAT